MEKNIKKILETLENEGYQAYLVGGYVRDYLLGVTSFDVDIATDALPKDIHRIFNSSKNNYGSVNIKVDKLNVDITTFRKDLNYVNRRPSKVVYINNLKEDLERRDFTINAICMNKNGKITSFVTPSQLYSNMNKIQDKKIAISISETPEALTKGIGKAMFDDLSVEIARHLLVTGAKLVYGGDLRIGGFTKLLCDLSCQYGIKEKSDPSTIYFTNYFAWPIFNRLSKSDIAEFKYDRVEIVKTEIPKGVGEEDKGKFFEPTTPSKMFLWANSLSIMRKEMEENVNARIVLGGKIVNFKGRMAGIFEEAICAIQKKHPIYLLGGFGGASAQIVKLMKGETTAEKLFEEAKTNEDYKKLIEYCQMSCLPTINYDELKKFENKDYQVLRNGLDKDENEILFNSINIPEIISLILKGINKAFNY